MTRAIFIVGLAVASGCRPSLDDRPWLVTRTQIVGWTAEPAEARPGDSVTLDLVALDPDGPPDTAQARWTLCRARKPLAEDRAVGDDCLAPAAAPDAAGDPVALTIPTDACVLFGPDTPQPAPGAPSTRPRDPDATGGYYQPVTIALGPSLAVGLARVTCDLPDASLAAARAFQAAYHPNQNPAIAALAFSAGGAPVDPGALPAGAAVTIEASWPAGSAETYALYDRASASVVNRQETLSASWHVTGGELDRAAAEIADPAVLSTSTTWTAPPAPTTVEIALVLRDSRGGSAAARATLVTADP